MYRAIDKFTLETMVVDDAWIKANIVLESIQLIGGSNPKTCTGTHKTLGYLFEFTMDRSEDGE